MSGRPSPLTSIQRRHCCFRKDDPGPIDEPPIARFLTCAFVNPRPLKKAICVSGGTDGFVKGLASNTVSIIPSPLMSRIDWNRWSGSGTGGPLMVLLLAFVHDDHALGSVDALIWA